MNKNQGVPGGIVAYVVLAPLAGHFSALAAFLFGAGALIALAAFIVAGAITVMTLAHRALQVEREPHLSEMLVSGRESPSSEQVRN